MALCLSGCSPRSNDHLMRSPGPRLSRFLKCPPRWRHAPHAADQLKIAHAGAVEQLVIRVVVSAPPREHLLPTNGETLFFQVLLPERTGKCWPYILASKGTSGSLKPLPNHQVCHRSLGEYPFHWTRVFREHEQAIHSCLT